MQTMKNLKGEITLKSNGENAKTAPVTIVANSGAAYYYPTLGPIVNDFNGMKVKKSIPLDWSHDERDSIGYINKFDTSTGELVCSGAITADDEQGALLIAKMRANVPYEASIEYWDEDTLFEFVEAGYSAMVNNREIPGPVLVAREWTLKAVAICKFGRDPDTSSSLQLSNELSEAKKESQTKKGFFLKMSNTRKGIKEMDTKETNEAGTVETVEVEKTPAVEVIEPAKEESKPDAEVTPETPEVAVEAKEPAEVAKEEVTAPVVTEVPATVEAVDPRAELKQFAASYGETKGVRYYLEGLTFEDAGKSHMKYMADYIAELEKKIKSYELAATSREAKAIPFTPEQSAKPTLAESLFKKK